MPPLPVNVLDIKLFMALAASLATLKVNALAIFPLTVVGGLYRRSESWE